MLSGSGLVDESRFFPNPILSSTGGDSSSLTSSGQTVSAQTDAAEGESYWESVAQQLLEKSLRNRTSHMGSLGPLYVGALGGVYLKWRMARMLRKSNAESAEAMQLLKEALSLIEQQLRGYESSEHGNPLRMDHPGKQRSSKTRVTLLEGPYVGCKALSSLLYYDLQEKTQAMEAAQQLVELLKQACQDVPMDECEVLYGRAGALQTILFLRAGLQDESLGSDFATAQARSILHHGIEAASSSSLRPGLSLLWTWHSNFYLGAAHGVVGILQTILSLRPDELRQLKHDGLLEKIRKTIDELDAYCFPSGNLDSSIHSGKHRRQDRLVQWCHGAPGHVLLLVKAASVFQDDTLQERAKRIAEVIWKRGLLNKGVGLCHGISGNAYALLSVGRSDPSFQEKAVFFADFALSHLNELEGVPDHPSSLYEGLAGLCCLAIDLTDPTQARFPLYEF